jgi:hypothetical protein
VSETRILQGRAISAQDVQTIRTLIAAHPQAHRRRLSQMLCQAWDWKNPRGQDKDMAARSLMRKLHEEGAITLPPPRRPATNAQRGARPPEAPPAGSPLKCSLRELRPIHLELILPKSPHRDWLAGYLAHHHYLGWRGPTGQNVSYLAWSATGRALACLVFDAAAWKVAARDQFIGWEAATRAANLARVANNSRFLILPWVRVPHLASHLLSLATGRLAGHWEQKYGHRIELVETFVERERFAGVCYRAANWIHLGSTRGRSRNDRDQTMSVPIKDVYVHPLSRSFRQRLGKDKSDG